MRYTSWAEGTRDEIGKLLANNLGAHRSPRRIAEAEQAMRELGDGATAVHFGRTTYVVTGEPLAYLVEIAHDDQEDVNYQRLSARSDTEAWKLAHELARGGGRVVALYRDVTKDEV